MNEKIVHDLRAPLARAKTITKLLLKKNQEEEWLPELLAALEELDKKISELSSSS
jgi:hypothetical protein